MHIIPGIKPIHIYQFKLACMSNILKQESFNIIYEVHNQ